MEFEVEFDISPLDLNRLLKTYYNRYKHENEKEAFNEVAQDIIWGKFREVFDVEYEKLWMYKLVDWYSTNGGDRANGAYCHFNGKIVMKSQEAIEDERLEYFNKEVLGLYEEVS